VSGCSGWNSADRPPENVKCYCLAGGAGALAYGWDRNREKKRAEMRLISYAQNFEDVMLWRALGQIERGFYIDVGAWSPDADSVTKLFSERGWRGINIEPNPELFAKLAERRPNDVNLNLAVGAKDGLATINFVKDGGSGLSTMLDEYTRLHQAQGWETEPAIVSQSTLTTIWSKYAPPYHDVHFLKIDVEGNEKAVLEGNDWTRNRPWVVLVEATLPNSQIECHQEWEAILLNADYVFAYADGLNRFYVSKERADLVRAFAYPPNVFDKFISAETDNLRAAVERSEARVSDIEAANAALEARIRDAESTNAALEGQIRDAKANNAVLETRISWSRRDHNLLQKTLTEERMRGEAIILDLLRRHEEIVAYRTPRGLARRSARRLIALGRRALGRRKHSSAIETIRLSIFFDPIWYRRENPDVATAFPDAAVHYYHHGAAEGRDPGPCFSTRQYLEAHALPSGTNPIIHYTLNHSHEPA
jgi:FkbM family methyltransferase